MNPKRPTRTVPVGRARGRAPLERYAPAYRRHLLDRGNAAGYVRNCEAAVAHLSMWMKQADKRPADVGEELVTEFLRDHLPVCG